MDDNADVAAFATAEVDEAVVQQLVSNIDRIIHRRRVLIAESVLNRNVDDNDAIL